MSRKKDSYLKRQADKLAEEYNDFKEQYEDSVKRADEIRKERESVEAQSYTDISMRSLSGRIKRLTKLYKEIEREIGNIKEDLADLQGSDYSVKEEVKMGPPNKRWRAEIDEHYWYMTTACPEILETFEGETIEDDSHYALGNYFKTEEEAKFEYERLKVINELKDWATVNNKNAIISKYTFCIKTEMYHARKRRVIDIVSQANPNVQYVGVREPVYFDSYADAENAVKTVGEERILKYYFIQDSSN